MRKEGFLLRTVSFPTHPYVPLYHLCGGVHPHAERPEHTTNKANKIKMMGERGWKAHVPGIPSFRLRYIGAVPCQPPTLCFLRPGHNPVFVPGWGLGAVGVGLASAAPRNIQGGRCRFGEGVKMGMQHRVAYSFEPVRDPDIRACDCTGRPPPPRLN
ncbi:uncharacterized protein LY79DRAFT_390883 [Colletotrichum navitas]|uniref:Uncharacterized protein n=1 Tax=Colletotrichum navitas TaxID=681940 RepID=A0AAD8PPQ9_9PEZI|nr:uncharacterized protein LY79DRAFT_390883 [Colletotrichum navitas]KAK1574042.1 hypothetical protein LY79DRAFT_390883 [Colletotrichum navitas]